MSKFIFILSLITLSLLSCTTSDEQIKNWVEKNPDTILKVLVDHQQTEQAKNRPSSEDVINNSAEIFENAGSPTSGSGTIKIAYFFDFNCGHCARQSETIKDVLAKKSNIQIIYKNFPVLGAGSVLAAHAALAAHQQGKYIEFYNEAFQIREKNPQTLKAIAKKIKLNIAKWEADMKSEAVKKEISHVSKLARQLKLSGTPALAIAPDQIYPGRVDELLEIVEAIKK